MATRATGKQLAERKGRSAHEKLLKRLLKVEKQMAKERPAKQQSAKEQPAAQKQMVAFVEGAAAAGAAG